MKVEVEVKSIKKNQILLFQKNNYQVESKKLRIP